MICPFFIARKEARYMPAIRIMIQLLLPPQGAIGEFLRASLPARKNEIQTLLVSIWLIIKAGEAGKARKKRRNFSEKNLNNLINKRTLLKSRKPKPKLIASVYRSFCPFDGGGNSLCIVLFEFARNLRPGRSLRRFAVVSVKGRDYGRQSK